MFIARSIRNLLMKIAFVKTTVDYEPAINNVLKVKLNKKFPLSERDFFCTQFVKGKLNYFFSTSLRGTENFGINFFRL